MKRRRRYRCEHCGKIEKDELDWQIFHRGCRLKAAFPEAVMSKRQLKGTPLEGFAERGLLVFNTKRINPGKKERKAR